jgi:hypothetical protein
MFGRHTVGLLASAMFNALSRREAPVLGIIVDLFGGFRARSPPPLTAGVPKQECGCHGWLSRVRVVDPGEGHDAVRLWLDGAHSQRDLLKRLWASGYVDELHSCRSNEFFASVVGHPLW